jgi:excisionase family DNA binding protein
LPGLKVHDVAARLNVSEKTVYKWLQKGLIPANRIGKTWIITEKSVEALLSPEPLQTETPAQRSHNGSDAVYSALGDETGGRFASRPERVAGNKKRLKEALAELNQTMAGAVEHGITGILGPRRLDPTTPAAIATELESVEGEVLLQGIGLREFFNDKDHTVILRRMAAEDRPVSVRALLVNPTGQFARARTVVQDGVQFADDELFRAGPLFGDSWRSLNVISSLKKASAERNNFRLDVRFLDHWPSTYLVLSRHCAFIETYHFGRADGGIEDTNIDGLVPMLRVSADSSYYNLLRSHFDYLWSGQNPFIPSLTLEQVADSVKVQV